MVVLMDITIGRTPSGDRRSVVDGALRPSAGLGGAVAVCRTLVVISGRSGSSLSGPYGRVRITTEGACGCGGEDGALVASFAVDATARAIAAGRRLDDRTAI